MATIVSTLYPPLIDTFMPAFPYKESAPVTFSFSPYNSIRDIKRIHVSLVNQKTNQSAFESNSSALSSKDLILLNSVWILDIENSSTYLTTDSLNNTCTIKIPTDLLKGDKTNFVIDCYYKVQIRFDNSPDNPKDTSYFINNRQFFSEWSSVCLIKAIPQIQIGMKDFDIEYTDIDKNNSKIRKVQPGVVPITGDIKSIPTESEETLQKYKIQIINNNTGEILDKTDWVYTSNNIDPNKIYWLADTTNAKADDILDVIIDAVTKNQYSFSKTYQMKISNFDTFEFSPQWTFQSVVLNEFNSLSEQIITEEDGYVKFNITSEENLPQGFLYVTRASSLDNFKKWELVSCTKNTGIIDKDFIDPTVSSLIKYRYACQYRIKKNRNWTSTKYSVNKNGQAIYVYPNFHDILIMRQNRQLAIRYNAQITSYSKVTNRQVINTLGSKYPKFAENAHINYKKFTLTGLLTAESDFNRKFLNDRDYAKNMEDYDKYMDGQYEVRNDTVSDGELTYETISARSYPNTLAATEHLIPNTLHDLYPKDNWWWEREFREQVINWLNDGEPKLFRSMTEGNIAVMITDISLTPNTQIGRRTYNISMTAYEIGDGNSLEELSSLGIINVPNEYEDYINGGIAEKDTDDDDSDDGTVTEITVGQICSKKNVDNKGIVKGTGSLVELPSIDNYNIEDFYNTILYQGALSSYVTIPKSFQLKDLRVQFESPPQWYEVSQSGSIELFEVEDEEKLKNYSYENLFLGYKLQLTLYKGSNKFEGNTVTIFVEEKGYYQVPSNLIVTEVILFDNSIATLDYKLLYKWTYDESSIPSEAEISEKIVGQISGKWNVQQNIAEEIKNKYEYYNISSDKVIGYDGLLERQYLDTITAFGFDGTSYAVLDIKFLNDRNDFQYVVGRTGVYNLMTDYPIDEATFLGRRMVRKDNPNYVEYRDNPYILDASAGSYQSLTQDSLHWYDSDIGQETDVLVVVNGNVSTPEINKIVRTWIDSTNMPYETVESIESPVVNTIYGVYKDNDIVLMVYMPDGSWKQIDLKIDEEGHIVIFAEYNKDLIITGKKKFFLEEWEFSLDDSANNNKTNEPLTWYKAFLGSTEMQVFINETNDINHYITNIDDLNIPAIDGYKSIEDIKSPQYNTVYYINKKYKIYYIDQQWYDVEFLEPKQEQTLILAKVPVYGMVNYRGNLVKLSYE